MIKSFIRSFALFYINKKQELETLISNPFFKLGFLIKIVLIICASPTINNNLFIPFINNIFSNFSFDPWTSFVEVGGDINSFPYGISMLASYLPLATFGSLLDKYFIDFEFTELFFKTTSLLFDFFILINLSFLIKSKSKNLLILSYWLSPIIFYTTYVHGQIDIVPVFFLISCISAISFNKYLIAGVLLAIAISCKFSMLIALPFILIYIHRRRGISREFYRFLFFFILLTVFLTLPFLGSYGYWDMVFRTKELERVYTVFVPYGENLKLYIVPLVYIFSLYLILRIKKITQDLFLISTGIGFFSILIFLPPAPGWAVWTLPFLAYYQIRSKRDLFAIGIIYNISTVLNILVFSSGADFNFLGFKTYIGLDPYFNFSDDFNNIIFTSQQAFGFLIALRMYLYGLRRNDFYSLSANPLRIQIAGNYTEMINSFLSSINNLIYQKNLNIISLKECIEKENKKDFNLKNKSFGVNKINKKFSKKLPYHANYVSKGFNYLNKLIQQNNKDFLFLINDLNIKNSSLDNKMNVKIQIDKNIDNDQDFLMQNNNYLLNFSFNSKTKNGINNRENLYMIAYFPIGFLHAELFNLLISVASLNVDTQVLNDNQFVKMVIEGTPSSEDVDHITKSLIPDIDDFSLKDNSYSAGYEGIMQLILIAKINEFLKNNKNYKF